MIVTKVDRNVIRELGRRPALEVVREVFASLAEEDQERVQQGLHIGRVINEYQEKFQRGDFLVRNVIGSDEAGRDRDHRRRPRRADGPVPRPRRRDRRRGPPRPPHSTNGRLTPAPGSAAPCCSLATAVAPGSSPGPTTTSRPFASSLGPVPVAGFFAMGEIGPVGGQNFVHGFTASIALFEEA